MRLARVVRAVARSVLKCHADKIALPPDHAAFANGVEIIECQFEVQGQDVKLLQSNSRATVCYVVDGASEYAALRIKEEQRALRDRRSADGSSFDSHSGHRLKAAQWLKPIETGSDINPVQFSS